MAHCPSAPPVNTSNQSSRPPPPEVCFAASITPCSARQSTPGVGICDTSLVTNTRPSVMNIFLRRSGMRNAFEKPFIIDMSLILLRSPRVFREIIPKCPSTCNRDKIETPQLALREPQTAKNSMYARNPANSCQVEDAAEHHRSLPPRTSSHSHPGRRRRRRCVPPLCDV